ncbi:ABC transporter ATP-binding protein [Clostridium cellulovorans]|uniref:ABC transporter transmembrane region n=1 Tax=Clostridium cellulovorans (strain ATCC 35296 / DSM 3052 / OCM 3 / 743B) TaxID=573061 RepID=D9SUT9_CLOC7|nr:ABC transporter ATP-binding protein [Clostridium cellulovorans]ADL50994.1 ABC transporter transmembrane region [Clostridium cellulovorans 743B]
MSELKTLYGWMEKYKFKFIRSLFNTIAAIILTTIVPLVTSTVIDYVLKTDIYSENTVTKSQSTIISKIILSFDTSKDQLLAAGIFIIILTLLAARANYLKGKLSAQVAEGTAKSIKDKIYDHVQRLSFSYHNKVETGDLLQRCSTDIETIRQFTQVQILEIFYAVSVFIVVFVIMLMLNPFFALVGVILIPILIVYSYVFFQKVKKAYLIKDEAEATLSTSLQETLTGVRVVKAYANQEYEIKKFAEKNANFKAAHFKEVMVSAKFWATSDFICISQVLLVVLFGSFLSYKGSITLGMFQTFLSYEFMMIWPVRQLGRVITEAGRTIISIRRILEVFDETQEFELKDESLKQKPKILGNISFKNVSIEYSDEEPVLRNISFEVKKGQTVAIIGKTGSGKTSLMNALLRLIEYKEGSITIDGTELNTIDKTWLRSHIGVVMQEIFLYSKSIKDNIRIANRTVSDEIVYDVAKIASVHDVILDFEEGYDTSVGERGVTLSGGQKQRIGIARALINKHPILIFDDSLSAVDTETDLKIRAALTERAKEITTFIIAHRMSTVKDADLIIVLDEGKILQIGTHEELFNVDGLYRNFWDIQNKKEEDFINLITVGKEENIDGK